MKKAEYTLILILSAASLVIPVIFVAFIISSGKWDLLIPFIIVTLICLILSKALVKARTDLRREVEYDEFGLSKTKGHYERLSKQERDAIDLQRTADMERVLNSTAIKKMLKHGSEHPEQDIDEMIGLVPVKQKMREMVARMKFEREDKKRKKSIDEDSMSGRHVVFYGSPGTGKTTVARILTGFLYEYGYIRQNKCVEVDGNFLKAGADTALKTELIIRQAFGGVLFVDEAYALMESGDGTGREAVATLIKQMEDNRGRFIVILAGYTNEMQMLLQTNPGFESRIKEYLDFPDYNAEEMRQIFTLMAQKKGFQVAPDALKSFDLRIEKERRLRSFGNGRTARNVLDETIDRHALNFEDGKLDPKDRYCIRGIDVSTELKRNGFR